MPDVWAATWEFSGAFGTWTKILPGFLPQRGKKPGRIQHQRSSMQSTGLPDGQEEAGLRQAHLRVSGSKLPIGLIRSLLQGTSSCQGLQSRSAYYGNKSLGRQPTARLYTRHGQESLMNSPPGNQQGNSGVLIQ